VTLVLLGSFGCGRPAEADSPEVAHQSSATERVRALASADEAVRAKAVAAYCTRGLDPTGAVYYPCILNRFLASGDVSEFLARIPPDCSGLETIWRVDETIMKGIASPRDIPKPFGDPTFVSAFLSALRKSATTQAPESLDRMLLLQHCADGSMAEMVEQSNLELFVSVPSLLVDNWRVVEKRKSGIGFGSTDFESRREAIERTFTDYCVTKGLPKEDCARAFRFLDQS
jgi:hypothetical protein